MKKVLIALDYDQSGKKVAETGYSMAGSMDAEVTLLHVIADPTFYSDLDYSPITGFLGYMNMSHLQMESLEGLKEASLQYLDKIKKHLGDNSIRTIIKEGDKAGSILETARELHADAIVMGSHSRRWLDDILMGSVTEKVLHQTSIPVLVVPTKQEKKK
ncbi:MAG: universal stress protein [Bacteroidales bacterium]|nr:universal stress protein [Bacteroidales bacterium]MBN2698879.1 universal stress protein [Bacteroidales bacterium]